ncbi:MAG: GNAT family N-acetyltransferase [Clostridiales bacterium]|jgi:ribosomal protein S18 acetylase RimI-like enzyme|nr:GNAT family N-acetyltransferase [Clostridiales bacterium]MDR2749911.1 GNAT family N-acetyltransferase [Clostridiales bacterium]
MEKALAMEKIGACDVDGLYALMERDFPSSERPPKFGVWMNLKREVYDARYLLENGRRVGYVVSNPGNGNGFALISFYAIEPDLRGKGYGERFLGMALELLEGQDVLVEVDDPSRAKSETEKLTRERRIKFYEKCGFSLVPGVKCKIFGVWMLLMHWGKRKLNAKEAMHGIYLKQFKIKSALRNIAVIQE